MVIARRQNLVSNPHKNNGFFFLLTIKYHIFIFKKGSKKFLYIAEIYATYHDDVTLT